MKQIIYMIAFLTFVVACKSNELEKKKKELSELKNEAKTIASKIDVLEKEISLIDTATKASKSKIVNIEEIKTGLFSHYIDLQGDLESVNNVMVNPKMGGLVTGVFVTEGQQVSAGQLLVQLDNSVSTTSLQELENQMSLANIIFEKQKRLWDQNIGTEIQYLQAKNNKESLEKRKSTTMSQIALSRIVAPFAGIVDKVNLKVGESAAPGMGGVRVVNMNNLKIVAKVADAYANKVKKGDKVNVSIPDLNLQFESVIKYAALNVTSSSRTFEIEVTVPANIKNLRPNLVAKISVNDINYKEVISIPLNLVQKSGNGQQTVMVAVLNNGKLNAVVRVVKTGESYGDKIIINEGLAIGDKIIVMGGEDLLEGEEVKVSK